MIRICILLFNLLFITSACLASFNGDEEQLLKCPFSLCQVVTQDKALEHFERRAVITRGGEARVYSVSNRETERCYALIVYEALCTITRVD